MTLLALWVDSNQLDPNNSVGMGVVVKAAAGLLLVGWASNLLVQGVHYAIFRHPYDFTWPTRGSQSWDRQRARYFLFSVLQLAVMISAVTGLYALLMAA